MKNIIIIASLGLIFSLFSCKEEKGGRFMNVNLTFDIIYLDNDDNDLLNPNFEYSYKHSEVVLFQLDNAGNRRVIESGIGKVDSNKTFVDPKHAISYGKYFLATGMINALPSENGIYEMYIQLSPKIKPDTIVVESKYFSSDNNKKGIIGGSSLLINKIWHNSKILWDRETVKSYPLITIKK